MNYRTSLAVIAVVSLPIFCSADSASLTIHTAASTAVVTLQSSVPLNALEGALHLPDGTALPSIDTRGSVVTYWIEAPHYSAHEHAIVFAGVIPRGVSSGTLFTLTPVSSHTAFTLTHARAFSDSPNALEVPLTLTSGNLSPTMRLLTAVTSILVVLLLIVALRHIRLRVGLS